MSGAEAARADVPARSFLPAYDAERAPLLGKRATTFRRVFELLEAEPRDFYTVIETGVAHLATTDGTPSDPSAHGHSTLLFDAFVQAHAGVVYSVDLSLGHCDAARRWVSDQVRIFCQDSRAFLTGFAPPTRIDCVYLDSYDVDWHDPHPSALHHMHEICALLPRLGPGCIVFVDDAAGGGGKAGYVADVMARVGAELLFHEYQIGWRLPQAPAQLRAFGHYHADELAYLLAHPRPRCFRYVRPGLDERVLELLPDGGIGLGRAGCEERWFVERGDDGQMGLVLVGGGRVTTRLTPDGAGGYHGRWLIFERSPVTLTPLAAREDAVTPGRYWLDGDGGGHAFELCASHDVGWGRSAGAETWRVERDDSGRPSLILSAAGRDRVRLERDGDGRWREEDGERGHGAVLDFLGPADEPVRAARAALTATRHFCYRRGDCEWPIELGPNGAVGRGEASGAVAWDVESDDEGGLWLLLHGRDRFRARLLQGADGSFHGRWPLDEHAPIRVARAPRGTAAYLMPAVTCCFVRGRVRHIVEVGGGDGSDAVALARHFDAAVTTFECNPDMVPLAAERVTADARVTLVPRAAGTTNGTVEFFRVINGNPYASSCFRANLDYPYERYLQVRCEVEMTRLDRWLDEHGGGDVDLLAMDVQGAALDVLRGLGAWLDRVRYIAAELDTRPIYHGDVLAPDVIAFLATRGFHLVRWFNQWGVLPSGELVEAPCFLPQYAGAESWFGDYVFVRRNPREAAAAANIEGRSFRLRQVAAPLTDPLAATPVPFDDTADDTTDDVSDGEPAAHAREPGRELAFGADGQVTAGDGGPERSWMVHERDDGVVELIGLGADRVLWHLVPGSDGRWCGRAAAHDRTPLILEPL